LLFDAAKKLSEVAFCFQFGSINEATNSRAHSRAHNMNRIGIIALAALLTIVVVAAKSPTFDEWKKQAKKSYPDPKTEAAAKKVYDANAAAIDKHNSDPKAPYKQKVNAQSDMTKEEFQKTRTGERPSPKEQDVKNPRKKNDPKKSDNGKNDPKNKPKDEKDKPKDSKGNSKKVQSSKSSPTSIKAETNDFVKASIPTSLDYSK
jgi:outer membrane biosynthesis protein TonB